MSGMSEEYTFMLGELYVENRRLKQTVADLTTALQNAQRPDPEEENVRDIDTAAQSRH